MAEELNDQNEEIKNEEQEEKPAESQDEEEKSKPKQTNHHKISNGSIVGLVITVFLALVIIFMGTEMYLSSRTKAQNIISREQSIASNFNKITLNKFGKVIIRQGAKESLKIEASQSIIDRITTSVDNGNLNISYNGWWWNIWWPNKDVKFYITVKNLNEVKIAGSGEVTGVSTIRTDNLDLNISGSGDIDLNVITNIVKSNITGSGNIILGGRTTDQEFTISGSGSYKARDLTSKNSKITINGSGDSEVRVSESLNVGIAGSGTVNYIGNPKINQNISGMGKIEKMDVK